MVTGRDFDTAIYAEARVPPLKTVVTVLWCHALVLDQCIEHSLGPKRIERRNVMLHVHGEAVEITLGVKCAIADKGMQVEMVIKPVSKKLRYDHHADLEVLKA